MGRAGAELFAQEGARNTTIDRDGTTLEEVDAGMVAAGGDAKALVADLSNNDAVSSPPF